MLLLRGPAPTPIIEPMPTDVLGRSGLLARLVPKRFRKSKPLVPVVRLYGAIGGGYPGTSSITLPGVAGQLEQAFEADGAKAVALLIRSPGGSAAQSHMIFQRIKALAAENEVKVYAFVEDLGASGGYMIACAADEIYADASSVVGSIGVVSSGFGFTGLIDKLGVERRVHTAGLSKAMLDPFLPENAGDIARLKELQREVHDMFIALVKASRGSRLAAPDEELFNGAFWAGQSALKLGLIDGLGDVRGVMRRMFGDEVDLRVVAPPGRGGLLRFILPQSESASAPPALSLVDPEQLMGALEARALWSRYGL
jgi:serine protease SohB